MTTISSLRNIGPKSAKMLADVGIETIESLREIGAVNAFHRLKFTFDDRVSLNFLWGMEAGLRDIPWQHLTNDDKVALKAALYDPE